MVYFIVTSHKNDHRTHSQRQFQNGGTSLTLPRSEGRPGNRFWFPKLSYFNDKMYLVPYNRWVLRMVSLLRALLFADTGGGSRIDKYEISSPVWDVWSIVRFIGIKFDIRSIFVFSYKSNRCSWIEIVEWCRICEILSRTICLFTLSIIPFRLAWRWGDA